MTKIFPHCTISVGLAPLADNDEDFSPLYDKCGARSARQLLVEPCCVPDCSKHKITLDSYSLQLIKCIVDSAYHSIPCHSRAPARTLAGWNFGPKQLRSQAKFWNQVWVEAGCPSKGVLFQIKKTCKHRFKYAVRKIRRQQRYIKRAQLASVFSRKSSKDFWASVKRTTRLKTTLKASVIDGVRGDYNIAELWASKLKDLLNTNHNDWRDFSQLINGHISFASLSELSVTPVDVRRSLQNLKTGKKDVDNLSSDHLRHAATVIAESLATLFTSILRHGYMPSSLRDCTVIPIPKGLKDASCSSNYRGIAIASTLSKVLEGVILHKYSEFFTSSDLQFGFKPGHSTTLCTGVVKCTISRYINRNSYVYGCFLDASKAFDLVDHKLLFSYLFNRGLPATVIRFLMFWYKHQSMSVRWNGVQSESFHVSNGVRQGGVLSPVLFSVYINGLLCKLKERGVGCHFGCEFVGSVCYADDLALLAPSPSALRIMLGICEDFAREHGLKFNAAKTQLIRFTKYSCSTYNEIFRFCGTNLKFSKEVTHLGHILSENLDDSADILRETRYLLRKANYILCTFSFADPFVQCSLLKSFCLSLYGAQLWDLSNKNISNLQVVFNKILRRLWNLPFNSHTKIVHCVSRIESIKNLIYKRFNRLYQRAHSCSSLVRTIFSFSSSLLYSFVGYSWNCGTSHLTHYSEAETDIADWPGFVL